MKNHETTLKNHGNQPKTMKNPETTLKNHGNQQVLIFRYKQKELHHNIYIIVIIIIIIINHILYVDANPVVSHTSNNPQGVDCISALAGLIRYLCKLIFATVHLHIYAFFYFFCNFRINIIQCFITTWYN